MNDVRRLLVIKANLETAMQRDLAPHIRAFAQQELDKVCKQIEEAREEWDRLFEQQEIDQLRARVSELEASNKKLIDALEASNKKLLDALEASNKKLLDALEDFVIDVEGYFGFSELDDIQPKNDMSYFIGEYRTAKNLIKKARGLQQ